MFLVRAAVLGEFPGAGHMTYLMAPLPVVYVLTNVHETPHPTLSTCHPSVASPFRPWAVHTIFWPITDLYFYYII